MRFLSLFSGVGGLDRAIPGHALAHVEWNPYAQRVLRRHWPDVPVLGDVREVDGHAYRGVDLVVGGPPCQAASHAGLQLGEADDRWMWPEFIRIVRESEPRAFLAENVPGLITLNAGRSFGAILSALSALGYFVRWDHCTAAEVGRPHLRDRVWIVGTREAGPRGWCSVPIGQVRKWPRAGWAYEGRTGEDVPRWPKREVWPLVCPDVCPPPGMWPTPNAFDANMNGQMRAEATGENLHAVSLHHASRLWPTPQHHDAKGAPGGGAQDRGGFESSVASAVKLRPTPGALDANNRASSTCARDGSKGGEGRGTLGVTLVDALRMWPTPTALDGKGSSEAYRVRKDGKERDRLDVVAGDTKDGRLNPEFVEWLMGWPIGWTLPEGPSLAAAPAPPCDVEPCARLTTVREHRRDRLRCTGNGVVTETASVVFSALLTP